MVHLNKKIAWYLMIIGLFVEELGVIKCLLFIHIPIDIGEGAERTPKQTHQLIPPFSIYSKTFSLTAFDLHNIGFKEPHTSQKELTFQF